MKNLLLVSALVFGTFAAVSGTLALDYPGYPQWAQDANISGDINN